MNLRFIAMQPIKELVCLRIMMLLKITLVRLYRTKKIKLCHRENAHSKVVQFDTTTN